MEYVLELKEEIWNEKWEKSIAIFLTVLLVMTVMTSAYNRADIWRNEMTEGITETAKSIVKDEIVKKGFTKEIQDIVTEIHTEKVDSIVTEVSLYEGVDLMLETPIEEVANTVVEASTETIKNTVAEALTEEIKNTMAEAPTEEIKNTVVEATTEEVKNTVVEVPTEEVKNIVEEVPTEEVKNTIVETPTEEVKNIVAEVPTEEIKNTIAEVPTEEIKNTVVEVPTEEVKDTVVEAPTKDVTNTVVEVSKEGTSEEDGITESAFRIDDAGMIYGFSPELADLSKGYLELPTEGCTGIRRGTFSGCTEGIAEIHIPSNIVSIEDGAMTELRSLEYMVAETGHPNFITVDGVLYDIAGTTLLAYPAARVGAYFVPEQVQAVAENAFLNTSLFIIDVRGCGLSANCLLNISESCFIIE